MNFRAFISFFVLFLLTSCSALGSSARRTATPDGAPATAQAQAAGNARFEAMVAASATAIHLTAEATPAPTHAPDLAATIAPAVTTFAPSEPPRPTELPATTEVAPTVVASTVAAPTEAAPTEAAPTLQVPPETPTSLPAPSEVAWEADPNALILRYWSPDRSPGPYAVTSIIPPLQIWGDGRVIWLSSGTVNYQRQLTEGYLSPDQLREMLQRIAAAGFFAWKDFYQGAAPLPYRILAVKLAGRPAHRVWVAENAPEGFGDLVNYLLALPGNAGQAKPYVPASALLRATQIPSPEPGSDIPAWPEAGYSLEEASAGAGISIDGETLRFAWNLVNEDPAAPALVQSQGKSYYITLAVPRVSLCTAPRDPAFDVTWSCP